MCKQDKEQSYRKGQSKIDFFRMFPWYDIFHKSAGKKGSHEGQDKKQYMKTGKFMRHLVFSGT